MSVKNSVLDTENGFLLYFEAKLDEGLEQLQTAEYYPMLDDAAKQDIREAVLAKVDHITESYCYSVMADLLKDDNPLAGYDLKFITKAEKKRLCPVITQKLINREIIPPPRMVSNVEKVFDNAIHFYDRMLGNLYRYRKEISNLLFDGRVYTSVASIEGSGDTHNHGKFTAIIETDQGKLVYKPRSCEIDVQAYHFMKKYFDDIIVMPKAFAVEQEFGVIEFLTKKISEGEEAAAGYYYALGGTTALLKTLGSKDMHLENLFHVTEGLRLLILKHFCIPM